MVLTACLDANSHRHLLKSDWFMVHTVLMLPLDTRQKIAEKIHSLHHC